MTNLPKLQHFVPQFLLKNWGAGKHHRVHVFDKRTLKSFAQPTKNSAAQRNFYNLPDDIVRPLLEKAIEEKPIAFPREIIDGAVMSAEQTLGEMESAAAPLVRDLLTQRNLALLNDEGRSKLSVFVALQIVRTPAMRERGAEALVQLHGFVQRILKSRGVDVATGLVDAGVPEPTAANIAFAHLQQMEPLVKKLAPIIFAKDWLLDLAPPGHRLWIGDDPVALTRSRASTSPHFGAGYGSDDADLLFPLSPAVTLRLLGPTTVDHLQRIATRAPRARAIIESLRTGAPRQLNRDDVDQLNLHQLANARQYIFSYDNAFDLARVILMERPDWREGSGFRMSTDLGQRR